MKKYHPRYPKPGDVLMVEFEDHTAGGDDTYECVVYGIAIKVNKRLIVVESWTCKDTDPDDCDNNERFAIVRNAITRCTILKGRR